MKIPPKLILPFFFFAFSCYYDSEEDLYPEIEDDCNTENITFSSEIVSLLDNHCWVCHSNNNAAAFGDNLKLENYDDVSSSAQDILGSIKHEPSYSPMPKGARKLNSCLIDQFDAWIDQGKPDN